MSKYTLHYFNIRARGELIRLLFAAAGVEYIDHQIKTSDWDDEAKSKTPLGQLPYLEFDGIKLPQSMAIAEYVAKEYNLAGKNNVEQAIAHAIALTLYDLTNAYTAKVFLVEVRNHIEEFTNTFAAKAFSSINKMIEQYGRNGFSVGDSLTWADIYIYELHNQFFTKHPTFLNNYPNLAKVIETVKSNPRISAYVKSRIEKRNRMKQESKL